MEFQILDSLERYSQLDSNIFGFAKIRFILNTNDENFFWIELEHIYLYRSSLEYKYFILIIKGIENGAVVR